MALAHLGLAALLDKGIRCAVWSGSEHDGSHILAQMALPAE